MKKLDYWEMVAHYKVEKEARNIHDIWIKWHNRNNEKAIYRLLKSPKYKIVSYLKFYKKFILKNENCGEKIFDIKEFEKALDNSITIWRGGGGKYRKNYQYNKRWLSFTASRQRADTFSIYNGTYGSRSFMLDKNNRYWIIELTLPLRDILLYYDVQDDEIIISTKDLNKAKLIEEK